MGKPTNEIIENVIEVFDQYFGTNVSNITTDYQEDQWVQLDEPDQYKASKDGEFIISFNGANMSSLITGSNGNDFVITGESNDVVKTGKGDDTILVGYGKDGTFQELYGGKGNDTYYIVKWSGDVTIHEDTGNDTLVLDQRILAEDITFARGEDNELIITDTNQSGSTITIESFFDDDDRYQLETIVVEGQEYDFAEYVQEHLSGTSDIPDTPNTPNNPETPDTPDTNPLASTDGDDVIHGTADGETIDGGKGNDSLYGEGGDDIIYGGEGSDSLHGGAGTDQLYGGDGNDTYYYEKGDGGDYIVDTEGDNLLVFGSGISRSDVIGMHIEDDGITALVIGYGENSDENAVAIADGSKVQVQIGGEIIPLSELVTYYL